MDEFSIPIDADKFRKTNSPWNDLLLNDPWSVGYVSMLIELQTFHNKEEWKQFILYTSSYEVESYSMCKIANMLEQDGHEV